jgi:hypothetical protein
LNGIWKYDVPLPRINILLPVFTLFAHSNLRDPSGRDNYDISRNQIKAVLSVPRRGGPHRCAIDPRHHKML